MRVEGSELREGKGIPSPKRERQKGRKGIGAGSGVQRFNGSWAVMGKRTSPDRRIGLQEHLELVAQGLAAARNTQPKVQILWVYCYVRALCTHVFDVAGPLLENGSDLP